MFKLTRFKGEPLVEFSGNAPETRKEGDEVLRLLPKLGVSAKKTVFIGLNGLNALTSLSLDFIIKLSTALKERGMGLKVLNPKEELRSFLVAIHMHRFFNWELDQETLAEIPRKGDPLANDESQKEKSD